MFRSGAQLMLLVLLAGLLLMRESRQAPAQEWDESFADFLAVNSERREADAPVTLVEINESSLRGHAWPWSPLDFALFFQSSAVFSPELLATDEVLAWNDGNLAPELRQKAAQYERLLREHLLRAPRVLLGAQLGYPEDPQRLPPLEEAPVIRRVVGDISGIPEFTAIEVQAGEGFRLSSSVGFTNLPLQNTVQRAAPLLLRYRGQVVPSLVLQAVLLWEKLSLDEVSVVGGQRVTLAGRVDLPIDAQGRLRVDFGAPRGRCGFDELVLASAQADAGRQTIVPRELLTGRVLLLSRTDPESRTLRFAGNRNGSPGEFFAAAIATIQSRSFIKRAPVWCDFALLGAGMLASLRAPRWRRWTLCFAAAVAIVVYTLIALRIFGATLIWMPIVLPAGLAAFIVLYRLVTPRVGPVRSEPAE